MAETGRRRDRAAGPRAEQENLARNALQLFYARASRYAIYGALIAACAVVLGTLLVAVHVYDGITLEAIARAHRENIALQVLDVMPFIFAFWGQYASLRMTRAAGAMVSSRTRSLREELEQTRYTAQAKTDFFARMSHELRTPLNAILGMSELLMENGADEDPRRRAAIIHEAAEGLLTLINDVLDYSKIEAGRLELDEVEFNLHECVQSTVSMLLPQAHKKGLRLLALIPGNAPRRLIGDPGRLRQILINLIGNAIKFTDRGEVVVSLKDWQAEGADSLLLHFEVADTGIGISPKDQRLLFQPYRQATEARTARRGGTGLGLSITKELVEAMHGTIGVDSESGQGSRFRFQVRLGLAEEVDLAHLARQLELRGVRLLLAEPPGPARDSLADQCRALGLDVSLADDGVDALQYALRAVVEGRPYELLLADMFLPCLDGETLGRRLLARPETAGLSVGLMTTAGTRGDAKRLGEAGFAGYLTRPVPPEQLRDLLAAMLAMQALTEDQRRRHGLITRHYLREHEAAGGRVLLIEDSEVNSEITVAQLRKLGCRVTRAVDGGEGLQVLRENAYDAALVDLQLPDMTGAQLIAAIRELPLPAGKTPLIVFTAGATAAEREQCRRAGADDFLLKPAAAGQLARALSPYLPLAGGAEAGEDSPAPDPQLIVVFLQEAEHRMAELADLLTERRPDLAAAARHLHTLKGGARHFRNTMLPELADKLEALALENDAPALKRAFPELRVAWEALQAELEQAISEKTVRLGPRR